MTTTYPYLDKSPNDWTAADLEDLHEDVAASIAQTRHDITTIQRFHDVWKYTGERPPLDSGLGRAAEAAHHRLHNPSTTAQKFRQCLNGFMTEHPDHPITEFLTETLDLLEGPGSPGLDHPEGTPA